MHDVTYYSLTLVSCVYVMAMLMILLHVYMRISDPFRSDGNILKKIILFTNETYASNMYF